MPMVNSESIIATKLPLSSNVDCYVNSTNKSNYTNIRGLSGKYPAFLNIMRTVAQHYCNFAVNQWRSFLHFTLA